VQAAVNFAADGDFTGNTGYNGTGPNKFISFDATADANTRLAYGANGVGTGQCAPGTGGTAGTGNQNTTHGDTPCALNPTIVVRAGTSPIQRPNGSGAGYNLLKADTNAAGNGNGLVDFSRASSARGSNVLFDSVTIGTDPLAMLSSSTTNSVPLSAAALNSIYSCTATTWSAVGGTSTATIKPLIPQVGSGTRTSFLSAIGLSAPGTCVTTRRPSTRPAIRRTPSSRCRAAG
jgi:hypothetical protein